MAASEVVYDPFAEDEFKFVRKPVLPIEAETETTEPEDAPPDLEPVHSTGQPPETQTPPPPPADEPEPEEPPVTEYKMDDGSVARITKESKKGYKYQLEIKPVSGNAQYWKANTYKELLDNLVKAQAHATVKIRQQDAELKNLRSTPAQPARKQGRELTPEEVAKANELATTEGFAAAEEYTQAIRTGKTKADREADAQAEAQQKLVAEQQRLLGIYRSESEDFLAARPTFHGTNDNRFQMVSWLYQKYIGRPTNAANAADEKALDLDESELLEKGFYTSQNLCKAFDVLDARGLLEKAPNETPAPVLQPPPTVPARIEPTATPQARQPVTRRRVTGLSDRGSSPEPTPQPTPAEAEKALEDFMSDPKISDEEKQRLVYGPGGFLQRLRDGQ